MTSESTSELAGGSPSSVNYASASTNGATGYANPHGYPVDTLGGITPCLKFSELPHMGVEGGIILCDTHECPVVWCAEAKDRYLHDLRERLLNYEG
jgi:hypothetical protein